MALSREVVEALNAQLGREFEAHLQYLAVSSHFDAESLPELSRFFAAQAAEEHDHALRFLGYLREAGGRAAIPALAAPRAGFESAEEAVAHSLEGEQAITAHIDELLELARRHHDHASEIFLHWFVTEQVEEVATMQALLAVVRRAGEGGLLLVEDCVARSSPGPVGEAA